MSEKNCILIFGNKKLNNFGAAGELFTQFASSSVYFDRIALCNYEDGEEVARTIKECVGNYGNIVYVCPSRMAETVKAFTENLVGGSFDEFGVLYVNGVNIFVMDTDGGKLGAGDIISIICKGRQVNYGRAYVKTVNAPRKLVDSVISEASALCEGCDFNVKDEFSDCTIEIVYPETVSKSSFDSLYRKIVGGLNDYIYALENVSLAERLFDLLKLRRMKISVAESFTGGGLAKRLVGVSGISEVYCEGLNTYSNESKMFRLGVDELTLKQYGAVSEKTAYEMVLGLLNAGGCDIAVSTTGIAGPKSDSTLKPVGLCYIGVGTREGISVFEYRLQGSREKISETAINFALFHAFKMIK